MSTVWGHSSHDDAERYDGAHATREEAIAEGLAEYGGEPFYILAGTSPTPESLMPTARQLIEDVEQRAYDNHPASEDWDADVSDEGKAELEELLGAWARKHLKVGFWDGVGEAELIDPADHETTAGEHVAMTTHAHPNVLRPVALALPEGCEITRYTFTIPCPPYDNEHEYVTVEIRLGTDAAGKPVKRWAILKDGSCWARERHGFSYEGMPSGRSQAYLSATRWDTAEEALREAAEHAVPFVAAQWAERMKRRAKKKGGG